VAISVGAGAVVASTILRNLGDEVHRSLARIVGECNRNILVRAWGFGEAAELVANGASNDSSGKHDSG
jgi:hypothetical protein